MKVIVYRSYVSKEEYFEDYGDSSSYVWVGLNSLEKVYELDYDEFNKLKKAVNFFNSAKKSDYILSVSVICEDDEIGDLLDNYNLYLKKEEARREKEKYASEAKIAEAKAKREAKKAEKDLERMAKKLNLSVDEFKKKLLDE